MQISEAESVVMDVQWKRNPLSAEEVVASLSGQQEWQDATVKTLLNRLLNKSAISAEKDGRRYLYAPFLQRDAWVQGESESLLARMFGGRVAPLVAHFSEQRKLSRKDIADLRKLLEELDDDGRWPGPHLVRTHRRRQRGDPAGARAGRPVAACVRRRDRLRRLGACAAGDAGCVVAGRAVAGLGRAGHRHAGDERFARRQ